MNSLWRDARSAWQVLAARREWTVVVVLSLAFGIGATTVVFSIVESVLLRPFPYPEPERIVLLRGVRGLSSAAEHLEQSGSLEATARYSARRILSSDGGTPVASAAVDGNVFQVLGVSPALGAGLPVDEVTVSFGSLTGLDADALVEVGQNVLVLSHGYWMRRFGGDRTVVGQTVRLGGAVHEIVGVMPEGFFFPEPGVDLWTPFGPLTPVSGVVARVTPGMRLERVRAELNLIARRLDADDPTSSTSGQMAGDGARSVTVVPIREAAVSGYRVVLWLLLGAVTLVLLIACANVANLLLARGVERSKELAVRATLGASRGMLVRQLVIESVGLALAGGVLAIGVAIVGLRAVLGLGIVEIPRIGEATINVHVLLFAGAVSLCTALLIGVVPALRASRASVADAVKEGGHTTRQPAGGRVRDSLVVAEVALSVLLIVAASLLVRSATAQARVDWGFDADGLSIVSITVTNSAALGVMFEGTSKLPGVIEEVLERVRGVPGVRTAGAATTAPLVPFSPFFPGERIVADGAALQSAVTATRTIVTPGYLAALGAGLRGRDFDDRDDAVAPRTAVLNERLARMLFPEGDAIGRIVHFATLRADARPSGLLGPSGRPNFASGGSEHLEDFEVTGATPRTVIGVVADMRMTRDLSDDRAEPAVYVDSRQLDREDNVDFLVSQLNQLRTVAIRTDGPSDVVMETARAVVAERSTLLTVVTAAPMRTLVSQALGGAGESALMLALSTVFGALSLLLAAAGIYGVISHDVSQRVHEIGIRLALGARPRDMARMVLARGLRLTAAGLAIGLAGAWMGSRVLESRLFGVTPTDPATFAGVTVFLLSVAAGASLLPARRASQVDPLIATRAE